MQSDRCPTCGSDDPKENVLDEVDIGVGTLYNRCHDSWHNAPKQPTDASGRRDGKRGERADG